MTVIVDCIYPAKYIDEYVNQMEEERQRLEAEAWGHRSALCLKEDSICGKNARFVQ